MYRNFQIIYIINVIFPLKIFLFINIKLIPLSSFVSFELQNHNSEEMFN